MCRLSLCFFFFFFNDTATTEIYTLSLHDALPIYFFWRLALEKADDLRQGERGLLDGFWRGVARQVDRAARSEEHTSELQSRSDLVCRLLLEKKKKQHTPRDLVAQTDHAPPYAGYD